MTTQPKWQLSGDYFENCNCSVVCPCLVSTAAPLTSKPTQDVCDVALIFHIDNGNYGSVRLDGLNVAMIAHTPGPMAEGNWTVAAYIDERADDKQMEALGAIFTLPPTPGEALNGTGTSQPSGSGAPGAAP